MTCRECQDRLSPHHDGALGAGEAAAVSAHLASCAACGREWEAYGRTMRALVGAPEEPPGLASKVDGAWRNAPSGMRPRSPVVFAPAAGETVRSVRRRARSRAAFFAIV